VVSELWYPKATRMPAPSDGEGGSWTGGGRKGLLHTTEGKIAADTFAVYRDKGFWAHFTATFEGSRFQIWQHIPLDRACRALDNEPGGVQTNRANVVQIELVGFADEDLAARRGAEGQYVERWPAEYLAGIAAWMRWVEANFAVPRRSTVRFLRYPASAGADNPNRLGGAAWVAYAGWLGHQHAPEQRRGHGDPGLIDIATLLRGEEEDISIVDQQTKQYLDEQFKQVLGRVDRAVQRIGGRPNTAYNNDNEAFQNLAMAKEALAEAREARKDLKEIKDHLGIH
jgi:hypothetical protein